jgi:RNA polymerase sigma factor (sigma-70 family)
MEGKGMDALPPSVPRLPRGCPPGRFRPRRLDEPLVFEVAVPNPPRGDEATPWLEPFGREPTPLEAAVLRETVEQLLAGLDEEERTILELSPQGYTTREIGERLGWAERTVRLLREGVRHRLERMQRESL